MKNLITFLLLFSILNAETHAQAVKQCLYKVVNTLYASEKSKVEFSSFINNQRNKKDNRKVIIIQIRESVSFKGEPTQSFEFTLNESSNDQLLDVFNKCKNLPGLEDEPKKEEKPDECGFLNRLACKVTKIKISSNTRLTIGQNNLDVLSYFTKQQDPECCPEGYYIDSNKKCSPIFECEAGNLGTGGINGKYSCVQLCNDLGPEYEEQTTPEGKTICAKNIENGCLSGQVFYDSQCLNACPRGSTKNGNVCIDCLFDAPELNGICVKDAGDVYEKLGNVWNLKNGNTCSDQTCVNDCLSNGKIIDNGRCVDPTLELCVQNNKFFYSGICLDSCPIEAQYSKNGDCRNNCSHNDIYNESTFICSDCSSQNKVAKNNVCEVASGSIDCAILNKKWDVGSGTCVSSCGNLGVHQNECVSCQNKNEFGQCIPDATFCLSIGQVLDGQECQYSCSAGKSSYLGECLNSCPAGLISNNGKCEELTCSSGFALSPVSNDCKLCDMTNAQEFFNIYSGTLSLVQGVEVQNNKCVISSCSGNYDVDLNTNQCSCVSNDLNVQFSEIIITPPNSANYFGKYCFKGTCPFNLIADVSFTGQLQCVQNCFVNGDNQTVQIVNNKCERTCSVGYYLDGYGSCQPDVTCGIDEEYNSEFGVCIKSQMDLSSFPDTAELGTVINHQFNISDVTSNNTLRMEIAFGDYVLTTGDDQFSVTMPVDRFDLMQLRVTVYWLDLINGRKDIKTYTKNVNVNFNQGWIDGTNVVFSDITCIDNSPTPDGIGDFVSYFKATIQKPYTNNNGIFSSTASSEIIERDSLQIGIINSNYRGIMTYYIEDPSPIPNNYQNSYVDLFKKEIAIPKKDECTIVN